MPIQMDVHKALTICLCVKMLGRDGLSFSEFITWLPLIGLQSVNLLIIGDYDARNQGFQFPAL